MKRRKPKDNPKDAEDVLQMAFMDMCKALDTFGPKEVLDLLVINSRTDEVVNRLLMRFPVVVAIGQFLDTLPTFKVSRRTYKRLEKRGYLL